MPSPRFALAIVAFWLATAAWLAYHDLWPRWRSGDRPPYTIDIAQEAEGRRVPRRWSVFYRGRTVGYALTSVNRREDDTYELHTEYRFDQFTFTFLSGLIETDLRRMDSTYRVTPQGSLRELAGELVVDVREVRSHRVKVAVNGRVEGGVLTPRWRVESPLGDKELTSDPVEVAAQHSMLNPLQPWNRLLDVQEDRRWTITLFDPLADSLATLVPGHRPGVRTLEAGVRQGVELFMWDGRDVPCHVIEYHGENLSGKTFVRQGDGLVLRQEVTRQEVVLALERDPR
jgi:hypothetical protein